MAGTKAKSAMAEALQGGKKKQFTWVPVDDTLHRLVSAFVGVHVGFRIVAVDDKFLGRRHRHLAKNCMLGHQGRIVPRDFHGKKTACLFHRPHLIVARQQQHLQFGPGDTTGTEKRVFGRWSRWLTLDGRGIDVFIGCLENRFTGLVAGSLSHDDLLMMSCWAFGKKTGPIKRWAPWVERNIQSCRIMKSHGPGKVGLKKGGPQKFLEKKICRRSVTSW
jgi:hypothetical protein